ncbi:hypothetical protein ACH5RR_032505 [Cinchona calisaya]|uniref:Adenylate kinase n=1 Tax=Cinchona calisaya TaxID=153742 RepID=A0ABD2YNJ2_9GENT
MNESGNDKFLIDGFRRIEENRASFELTGIEPAFVLFFDFPEEEMERRLLSRNQIDVAKPVEEVFEAVKVIFTPSNDEVKLCRPLILHPLKCEQNAENVWSS